MERAEALDEEQKDGPTNRGLTWGNNSCYFHAIVQCLYHIPELRKKILEEKGLVPNTSLYAVQSIFFLMSTSKERVPYLPSTHKKFYMGAYKNGSSHNIEQDAYEGMMNILNEYRLHFHDSENAQPLVSLPYLEVAYCFEKTKRGGDRFKYHNQHLFVDKWGKSPVLNAQSILNLAIHDDGSVLSVQSCIDAYNKPRENDGSGCEGNARMFIKTMEFIGDVKYLPIVLQRFRNIGDVTSKIVTPIELNETLSFMMMDGRRKATYRLAGIIYHTGTNHYIYESYVTKTLYDDNAERGYAVMAANNYNKRTGRMREKDAYILLYARESINVHERVGVTGLLGLKADLKVNVQSSDFENLGEGVYDKSFQALEKFHEDDDDQEHSQMDEEEAFHENNDEEEEAEKEKEEEEKEEEEKEEEEKEEEEEDEKEEEEEEEEEEEQKEEEEEERLLPRKDNEKAIIYLPKTSPPFVKLFTDAIQQSASRMRANGMTLTQKLKIARKTYREDIYTHISDYVFQHIRNDVKKYEKLISRRDFREALSRLNLNSNSCDNIYNSLFLYKFPNTRKSLRIFKIARNARANAYNRLIRDLENIQMHETDMNEDDMTEHENAAEDNFKICKKALALMFKERYDTSRLIAMTTEKLIRLFNHFYKIVVNEELT